MTVSLCRPRGRGTSAFSGEYHPIGDPHSRSAVDLQCAQTRFGRSTTRTRQFFRRRKGYLIMQHQSLLLGICVGLFGVLAALVVRYVALVLTG